MLSIIALVIIGVCPAFAPKSQTDVYIDLQNQKLTATPKEFYIANIDDERSDKTSIGKLLAKTNTANAVNLVDADLKGGTIPALNNFVGNSFSANSSLRPIIIKLKTFSISETAIADGKVNGRIVLAITFGFERDEDFILLDSYNGGSTYQRNIGPEQQIEPLLRSSLNNMLLYINNWMNKQVDNNINLAHGVKISFTDHAEEPEGDTIYYRTDRPLTWADFMDKPHSTRFAAEVFAGLGYTENVKLVKGIVNVRLDIKVYVPKSASWVRYDAMNGNSLNHEQLHFDIVKLVAEHFKRNVLAERLNVYNYDGPINVAYFDALREIDALQKQYDSETVHGTNAYRQQQWAKRIDKELQQFGIKPLDGQAAFN